MQRTSKIVVMVTPIEAKLLKALASRDERSVSGFVRYKLLPLLQAAEADHAAA